MTNVKIPDVALSRALESSGVTVDGATVDAAALARLGHLDWSEDGMGEADPKWFMPVTDLTGLEHATGLRVLGLGGNTLRTLARLAGHPALEELWLNHSFVGDVSALATMPRLRIAVLDGNPLVDIGPLAAASNLTYVNISSTQVSDLTPLEGLTRLTKLSFHGLQIASDSPSFETLVKLGLRGCELIGAQAIMLEVRTEVDRRKALDVAARRAELLMESSGDALLEALLSAKLDEMAARLKDGGASGRDALGRTLLHLLVAANVDEALRAKLTRELLAAGVDVNAVQLCAPATSALGLAIAKSRSLEYLSLLLALGADPNAGRSRPPLLIAAEASDASRIDLLLDAGASVAPAFARIIECGSLDVVKRAIAAAPQLARTDDLVRAVKRKSEGVVRALLDAGVDPNGPLVQDAPVLHHVEGESMFDLLLAAGADVNARGSLGTTPLFSYLRLADRSPDVATTLVRKAMLAGATPNVQTKSGRAIDVLAQARVPAAASLVPILKEHGEALDALGGGGKTALDLAASPPMKAALKAAKVGSGATVVKRLAKSLTTLASGDAAAWAAAKALAAANQRKLLAPFAPLLEEKLRALGEPLASAFSPFETTSEPVVVLLGDGASGVTAAGAPLLHAVLMQLEVPEPARQAAVRALLTAGANTDALDAFGTPALNVYLDYTKTWDVELVAKLATDAAVRPKIARTALAIAAGRGLSAGPTARAVADLLLERGSDVSTVVDAACYGGRLDLVRRAVEAGAAIPDSALHSAVCTNAVDVAAYLLERGADPNRGATVHPLIVDVSSVEMLDLLVAHGADPFVLTSNGETPLHLAARKGMPMPRLIALLERLEALGIPRSVPDARGQTALATLQARQEPEVQAFLARG